MRHIHVIGMGAGDPDQITAAGASALRCVSCVLAMDKGERGADLRSVRLAILEAYAPEVPLVEIPDPPRDRHPADYEAEVARWHRARAARIDAAISDHVPDGGHAAFLVWGDPSLYDSTLRILSQLHTPHRVTVHPGITAIQALTAAHAIPVNRVGEAIHVTTGRQLPGTTAKDRRNCVVMLDAGHGWMDVATENTFIYWGAYLGMPQQVLASGLVSDVGGDIAALKDRLRARHGWIMDTYLLREDDRDQHGES